MRTPSRRLVAAVGTVAIAGAVPAAIVAGTGTASAAPTGAAKHVLLLSVDGLHQSDLAWYVKAHPHSALARLVHRGVDFTNASTTFPSDSFPGMIAQLTGANPGTAGVYYDDTYNRRYLAPGTTDCATAPRGTEIPWTEGIDRSQNPIALGAGQQLTAPALTALVTNSKQQTLDAKGALTSAILHMTGQPQSLLDPAALPVDPATCLPTYPHQYIRVNSVFDVAHSAGLRTAWSDKHPAYEILNGPSGNGIDDLFTPEINSVADSAGDDWSTDNALTEEYDSFKVAAILNEIDGRDHSGARKVGTPAIFGMNFQTVSTAQKLPTSDGLAGGYTSNGTPGPLLQRALGFVNGEVGAIVARIAKDGLTRSTTIILSAKHGQSPIDPAALRRVDDGAIIDALNAAWAKGHPSAKPLVSFSVNDDAMLLWLSNRSSTALSFAKNYLLTHSAPANRIGDAKGVDSTTVTRSGLTSIAVGTAADRLVGAPAGDPHAPDLIGIAQHGVVYTGGVKKIAEHGGAAADDRHVPLIVAGPGATAGRVVTTGVATTRIAPTILALLGLPAGKLDGVRLDGTRALPLR
ncbi:MAG: alkaline phosphatase family protein [Jatrophihabitans sp.]|uniref:alkaline phosphatase family protein n=1 Tax=Jatrophihabitans sp. TaxID=1932789 RepID=UPI003F7F32D1